MEFELDPGPSSIHYLDGTGQPMSWQELPTPQTGFVTPDAEGLGGLRSRGASSLRAAYGAITFASARPERRGIRRDPRRRLAPRRVPGRAEPGAVPGADRLAPIPA